MTEASVGAATSAATPAGTPSGTLREDAVRRAVRLPQQGYLGGVASGLAEHLQLPVAWVRTAFVVTTVTGFGPLFYAGLWLALPLAPAPAAAAPGLEAAARQGKRPGRVAAGARDTGVLVAGAAVALGVAGLVGFVLGSPALVWPAALAVVGVAVLWRQADEAQRGRWSDATGRADLRRVLLGPGSTAAAVTRVATGLGLLVTALVLFAVRSGQWAVAGDVLLTAALAVLGLALTLGPWLLRLARDLAQERAERVRSQERADVAAHLHDSVLQTLALIQRSAGDPATVGRLARAQERDLRAWMFGGGDGGDGGDGGAGRGGAAPTSLGAALRAVAAEVEDAHGTPVEVVVVGDTGTASASAGGDAGLQALVGATREAVANAARHSGAARVDVYAEVAPGAAGESVEVFVRDRGCGFDPVAVPADRHGLRRSVVDRVERHGGTAVVRSAPGEGTEVRLRLERRADTRGRGGPA
ncbi:MAG: two-component system sensor kinase [uncultured Nocardioidaceae bacterium]|uniref:Two-component system sensor kinase n=1 Tax=uncultured Nocardioidaceae bacterium TaxID=253824 RepID=A0A6J4LIX2_9ACTN|nr:MAG: two-component system sensor kinase [uncultured Nocardioidaceae bacterium]